MVETPSALIAGTEAEISVSVVVNNTPFDNQKGTRPTMASKQYPFSSGNLGELKCVNTVSLRLCLEYCQSCQSCQFDQLVTLYLETNTFNWNIQVIFHHF